MTSLFEDCINGRFILNTTEAQDTSVFLNDGSHHDPSGLNRQNQLGTIQDADQFLPFSYDAKSMNGLQLPDDIVQTRQPDLCFERNPFGKVEPPYFIETNMDILSKEDCYPDGTRKNPTVTDFRQTDNQTVLSPAMQAIGYQNVMTAIRMDDLANRRTMNQIYQYQRQVELESERRGEEEVAVVEEEPAVSQELGNAEPEEIFEEAPVSLIPEAPPAPPVSSSPPRTGAPPSRPNGSFGPRGEVGMDLSLRNQALELISTIENDTEQLRAYAERWDVPTRYKRNNALIPRTTLVNKLRNFIRQADRSILEGLFE